ncbi:MAG: ABC transporter substrate-binding protein [Zoogloeaceae bacterium]|nr:ABC transporter substrate-binding protein [Zoogloeaceae bacterium]
MNRLIAIFLLSLFAHLGFAADAAPDALVREVTNDVLAIVRQDKAIQSGDTRKAIDLVEAKVLPHFDFKRMTALAVGRDWRQASPAQQDQLVDAFKTLLVRTYSNALTQYRDQAIDFKPLRAQPDDTDVVVRTEVKQSGARPVQIDYSLEKSAAGWKVYDVIVGGVSLVTNYRGSFAQEIKASGIDGLIKSLQAKNKEVAAGAKT